MKRLFLLALLACLTSLSFVNAQVNITYVYKNGDTEWYTETKTATAGGAYPDLYPQPKGVKYTTIPSGTVTGDETFTVNCELTGDCPVKLFSADFASAKWVFLSMYNSTYHLRYVANQNYITVNTSQTTRPGTGSTYYDYQWAFVGNPITGFKIMNRKAGNGKILASASPANDGDNGGNTYPVMMDESSVNTATHNKTWSFTNRYYGVLLSRSGESYYMNNRGGKLAYWTAGADYGSIFIVAPVSMTMTTPTLDTSKTYMLVNKLTGKALADKVVDDAHVLYPIDPDATDHYGIWTVVKNGSYYQFKNYGQAEAGNSYYISTASPSGDPNARIAMTTTATSGNYYVRNAADDGYYYLLTSISTTSGAIDRVALADNNGEYTTFGGACGDAEEWELREVTPADPVTITLASSITSGNYYRLVNRAYTGKAMADTGGKVAGVNLDRDAYSQVWKLTKSGSTYSLQNALTGKYIQMNPGTSAQFSTGTTARYFTSHADTSDGTTYFAFDSGNNGYNSLHCASSQNYFVVGWTYSGSNASYWSLENVTLTSADLAQISNVQAIANGTGTNYTTQLSNFFSDYACTTLKSNYASMTDDALRSAMSNLPSALQEMAVRVKNDTWNSDATYNRYEKDFRIHDYEIYSNGSSSYWGGKTGIGPFAHLFNPTGIQAKAGDIVYLFVDSNVKDSNATLEVECVTGTNRTGTTKTLSRGYNALYVNTDCELFISYLLNSTTLSCNSYPDIKVHIEGATCTGCFDMHRGHTNNDWMWLVNNMFQGKYLHVKGNSVLLNLVTNLVKDADNPTGIMKIWDFIFDTEESFAGCNQWKKTGQYKMMINSFHNEAGGNPHWGSGNGTSHPNLTTTGCFNYHSLANGGLWEVAHEIGHGHQAPIKLAGTDESSNNVMSQIIQFLPKVHIEDGLFESAKATRNNGVKAMTERYNDGWAWLDYIRDRMDSNSSVTGGDDNIANRWLFQLWMYFDFLGNYQPEGGNDGFAFVGALYDKLRADGLGTGQSVAAENDYLKMAKYCAEITETDLDEFFEAWGFWRTTPKYYPLTITSSDGSGTQNTDSSGKYQVGGYASRNVTISSTTTSQITSIRNQMKAYTKKGGNIMFIEDRGVGCGIDYTVDGLATSAMGDVGYYGTFDQSVSGTYEMSVSGTTVTMSGGTGAVGFKIYDDSGNLVAIANTNTFTVPEAVATGLTEGTYSLKIAKGDGTDVSTTTAGGTVDNSYGIFTLTTDVNSPVYYVIRNFRSGKYATYAGASSQLTQQTSLSESSLWYFMKSGEGVSMIPAADPSVKLATHSSATSDGATWYLVENPYNTGYYCVSLNSDLSDNCWDDQGSSTVIGYWHPSGSDYEGTSWVIEELPVGSMDFALRKVDILNKLVGLSPLSVYTEANLAAVRNATTEVALTTALEAFNTSITVRCNNTNNYLKIGDSQASFISSPTGYEHAILIESAGDGSFYLKGYVSEKYLSNVYVSTQITTDATATTPFLIQRYSNGSTVIRPAEWADSGWSDGYHYIHNNGCVGWEASGANSQHTIADIALPATTVDVTYEVWYNGSKLATSAAITQGVGDAPVTPNDIDFAYTTYTYDVAAITANTTTVKATATFNMPFETSTNYDGAKWYYMHGHASWDSKYISTNGDATVWGDGNSRTDAYQWAFIGNPVEGIKVINKAAGSGKYLMGTDPATMGTTAKAWVLKQQTADYANAGGMGFGLYDATLTYLNTQGTTLKYWGQFDQGSTYWVEEVPDDYASNVASEITPWFETYGGGYFQLKSSVVEANRSKYEAALVTCDLATYEELTTLVSTVTNFIQPEAGTYRIKSAGARPAGETYMAYNEGLVTVAAANKLTDRTTVMELTGSDGTYKISIPYVGLNVQAQTTRDTKFPATAETGVDFQFVPVTPGHAAIINQDSYQGSSFAGALHEAGGATPASVVNWNANAEASIWTIEEAEYYGDMDGDGVIDADDIPSLVNILVGKATGTSVADVDKNGQVTLADLTALINIIRRKNNQ